MRLLALTAALAAPVVFATPALAQSKPVECIYNTHKKSDWPLLTKVVRAGMVATNNEERLLVDQIGASVATCRQRYGWGKKRQDVATRYFAGRVLATDSTYHLKKFGLDYEKLKALVAALDAPTRQAYVAGNVTNDQSAATFAALKTLGIDFAAVPAEDRAMFGQKLSQGILGLVVEQEAEAAYAGA
jgi:hypothetical protein